ncbi:hypothetical protein [Teredinibacter purpureus]|uniref:hypothetical protein n=1 Tax=Teredinibacter purpureus TaxID=2731756 RepID=UPI0005F7D06A|nr:hypothetical protein [Teredinibacter purpureus]
MGAIYAISLALISERLEGEELITANAGYSVKEGVGGTLGVLFVGIAMDLFTADGTPYVILLACILYFSFVLTRLEIE